MLTVTWVEDSYRVTTSNQELNERLELAKSKFPNDKKFTIVIPCLKGKSGTWLEVVLQVNSLLIYVYNGNSLLSYIPLSIMQYGAVIKYDDYNNKKLDALIELAKSELFRKGRYTYKCDKFKIDFECVAFNNDYISLTINDTEYCLITRVAIKINDGKSVERYPRFCANSVVKAYKKLRKSVTIKKYPSESIYFSELRNLVLYEFEIKRKKYASYRHLVASELGTFI